MELKSSGEYLEEIGWGKYNQKVFFQCGVAWATDMMWSANIAYILEGLGLEYGMSGPALGAVGACFPLGLMFGAFTWGLIGDKYGRMYSFKSTVCISTFFSLLLTCSVHPAMCGVALVFLGFGMGGELSLGGTVFCEFCPPSKSNYLTLLAFFWGLGGTVSAMIAFITVMTNTTDIYSWRYIVGSGFVIEVFCLMFRFFMEETPAYALLVGQIDKAEKIFNNISVQNNRKEFYLDTRLKTLNRESVCSRPEQKGQKSSKEMLSDLFKGNNLKLMTFFGIVISNQMYFTSSFAYTSILYFMPILLSNMSTSTAYGVILIQQACGIPGTIIGSKLVDTKLGRKFTIVLSFALAFLCCFLFYINQSAPAIITCTSILNFVVIMGYSAVYTITPESYQTEVRNLGVGAAGICARIAAIICPVFTGWLLEQSGGFQIALIIFAALFGATAASVLPLKETRPAPGDKSAPIISGH